MSRNALFVLLLMFIATPAVAQANGDSDPPSATDTQDNNNVTDPTAAATANANANAAMYNAQAAASNAQKAAIDAKAEAAKSAASTITGVTATPGGATTPPAGVSAEGSLLVTLAARDAAKAMADNLAPKINGHEILVLTDIGQLSAADAMQFDLQIDTVRAAMTAARATCIRALSDAKGTDTPDSDARFALPAIGAAIDAGTKLLSYFQTDYSFATAQIAEPTNLTAGAVAEALLARSPNSTVVIPSNLIASDIDLVRADMSANQASYIEIAGFDARIKALATANRTKNPSLAAELDGADAQAGKAMSAYDSFTSGIIAAPATGVEPPIVRIVRGKLVQSHIRTTGVLVLLVIDQKIAETYTKKNLWTFFGSPPLFTMGGISSVYILFSPSTGVVLSAGVIPKHGGYKSVKEVETLIK